MKTKVRRVHSFLSERVFFQENVRSRGSVFTNCCSAPITSISAGRMEWHFTPIRTVNSSSFCRAFSRFLLSKGTWGLLKTTSTLYRFDSQFYLSPATFWPLPCFLRTILVSRHLVLNHNHRKDRTSNWTRVNFSVISMLILNYYIHKKLNAHNNGTAHLVLFLHALKVFPLIIFGLIKLSLLSIFNDSWVYF